MKFLKPIPCLIFMLLTIVLTVDGFGQQIERYVMPVAGATLTHEDYILQFTLGESYAQTVYDDGQLTQGFTQEWAVVTAIEEPEIDRLDVKVYPNLTPGILNIEIEESVEASVFDLYGHMLKIWHIESGRNSVQIDELPSGMYVIVFKAQQGNKVSSVKVEKIQ